MKLVECAGSPRQIGQAQGEALREEIRTNAEIISGNQPQEWDRVLATFVEVAEAATPRAMQEMRGMAEGAGLPEQVIFRFNFPLHTGELDAVAAEGCTNIAMHDTPDGPLWGKTNDGLAGNALRVPAAVLARPDEGIPNVTFTHAGALGADGVNAEGLSLGHSSVGSIFQQSYRFPQVKLWTYEALRCCRTAGEFLSRMLERPLRGKGHSMLCVDRRGSAVSLESACPLVQVRAQSLPGGLQCVNCYQLPQLQNADRRDPEAKRDALARAAFLDNIFASDGPFGLEPMKKLLRDPAICRDGTNTPSVTEFAMIGLCAQGKALYTPGHPCEHEFVEVSP